MSVSGIFQIFVQQDKYNSWLLPDCRASMYQCLFLVYFRYLSNKVKTTAGYRLIVKPACTNVCFWYISDILKTTAGYRLIVVQQVSGKLVQQDKYNSWLPPDCRASMYQCLFLVYFRYLSNKVKTTAGYRLIVKPACTNVCFWYISDICPTR